MTNKNLQSKTLEQILEVIGITKSNYAAGIPLNRSYHMAVQKVADTYEVRYQTIGDACRRRLGLKDIQDFYNLLKEYLNGYPDVLISVLKEYTDSTQHGRIDHFFQDYPKAMKAESTLRLSLKPDYEVFSFRLDQNNAKKLKTIAVWEELSIPEWLSKTVKKIIEQQSREWAKSVLEGELENNYISGQAQDKDCDKSKGSIENHHIEGNRQRKKLYELQGNNLNHYPILYSAEHMVSPNTKRYFFGIAKYNFEEQVDSNGYVLFICEKAETTFFIPAKWILNHTIKPLPQNLKINILLEDEDKYFWQNKKDGILINEFKKKTR
ncbi:MAG TPA: hypothetical protein ENH01_05290 [Nitrospirae bacterium]|nr:hypothetical protein [Nitrospirota bacterium]